MTIELKFQSAWVQVTGLLVLFLAAAAIEGDTIGNDVIAGVLLSEPINQSVVESTTVNFTYFPVSNNTIHHVELWVYRYDTGTWYNAANNTTNVINGSENYIEYILPT